MNSPKIQKEIVSACAQETVKVIIDDLDGDYVGLLIEKDIFVNISNDAIIDRFQNMKTRRCQV